MNVPIVAIALVAGRLVVPPSADAHPRALDPVGAVLSMAGLIALVYAIIEAPANGWLSAATLGVGGLGLAILAAWVWWELRSSHPMVNLRIFADARFSAASFAVTMIFFGLFGWLFLFTQQLQFVLGYDALQAGVRALPFAVTMGLVSPAAAQLAARIGTKVVVAAGLAIMAGGFVMVSTSTVHTRYPYLMVASVVVAAGMALAMAPATESIMGSLPPSQAGVGSAVNDTTREVGGALGVAIIGSVASSLFASHLHAATAHLAGGYSHAASSLGAALAAARHTPGPAGQALAHAAQHAFITGSDTAVLAAIRRGPARRTGRHRLPARPGSPHRQPVRHHCTVRDDRGARARLGFVAAGRPA